MTSDAPDSPVYLSLPSLQPPTFPVGPSIVVERQKGATCFVTMGFGKKTDFASGRTLDLDKVYKRVIKPAAESAGLNCVRADEVVHSGLIDMPMFGRLLDSEVVVADLSASHPNTCYELGVRHALSPRGTIVIAESQFRYPFHGSQIVIRSYEHLGEGLDFDEVERFRKVLTDNLHAAMASPEPGSPVYVFLNSTPDDRPRTEASVSQKVAGGSRPRSGGHSESASVTDQIKEAIGKGSFAAAGALLAAMGTGRQPDAQRSQRHELAVRIATGWLDMPESGRLDVLEQIQQLLVDLQPDTTNDTEILTPWAELHARLWAQAGDRNSLDTAITTYDRVFKLRGDFVSATELARLLYERASRQKGDEQTADFVLAKRVKREARMQQVSRLMTQLDEQQHRLEEEIVRLLDGRAGSSAIEAVRAQLTENRSLYNGFALELDRIVAGEAPVAQPALRTQTVFVSSTYQDLTAFRNAVKDQINRRGMLFRGMEDFGADPYLTPAHLIVEEVKRADVFLGIVGFRYGYVDPTTGLSMTELEFNAATTSGKPMLVYVVDDAATVKGTDVESSPEGKAKLDLFKTRLLKDRTVGRFESVDELALTVYRDLGKPAGAVR